MTGVKEKFVQGIANRLGRDKVPSSVPAFRMVHDVHQHYLADGDLEVLCQTFITNSEAAGTAIFRCDESSLNNCIVEAAAAFGQGPVLLGDHVFFNNAKTLKVLGKNFNEVHSWDQSLSREENIGNAESATVGIAKAELGLAESGTVVLFSHGGSGRSVSLLPSYTVSVIREREIRPRLTQAMSFLREQVDKGLASSINLISGASSTADIELVRVQGVHGPLATAYVIVS